MVSRLAVLALAAALLFGCSAAPHRRAGVPRPGPHLDAPPRSGDAAARELLYRQYREWKGVRYLEGGLSKRGVDCSGFVFVTFRDRFGIVLPRKVVDQARRGEGIPRKSLRPGDLVFFKTGLFSRHVGIYVGQRTFLHVSTKKGVAMSSLDDRYWSGRYWQSKRLLPG